MQLKPLIQPRGSHLCGQYCVAMAAQISIAEASMRLNSPGRTKARQVAGALEGLGFNVSPGLAAVPQGIRARTLDEQVPLLFKLSTDRALLSIKSDDDRVRLRHWVLWWDGHLYDPDRGMDPCYDGVTDARIVSQMLIRGRDLPCQPIHLAVELTRKRKPRTRSRTSRRSRKISRVTTPVG